MKPDIHKIPYVAITGKEPGLSDFTYIDFGTEDKFKEYLWSQFKSPGEYKYNDKTLFVKKASYLFEKNGEYTDEIRGSYSYMEFWNKEKEKCKNGVIISDGVTEWYFPPEYYFWLNYLQIYNKAKFKYTFPELRDVQHYLALYELLAVFENKHCAVVKKRQISSSYYHCAKLIHHLWFYEGCSLKLLAYKDHYITGDWEYLNEYKNFLNTNTGWFRPMLPEQFGYWQQKQEIKEGNKKKYIGLKGTLKGITLGENPTSGVGGPSTLVYYEEAGISPTMSVTYQFMKPALMEGLKTTGLFIAAGSVGDLDSCQPLKNMIYHPEEHDILSVPNKYVDSTGIVKNTGLFIPEQYGMAPYMDEYGNSLVEEALIAIKEDRELKKKLPHEEFLIYVSQKPMTLEEAFNYRKISRFPISLIKEQIERIEEGKYPYECVELVRKDNGKIEAKETHKRPIDIFPIPPNYEYKEGVIQIWEHPSDKYPFGTYIASVDPVAEGVTTTSNSLASVYIYRHYVEKIIYNQDNEKDVILERPTIVACWTGRYDDIDKTNKQILDLCEYYNAQILCENNVTTFINYAIRKRKQHLLIRKNDMVFLKEFNANVNVFQEYGWKNTGDLFKNHMLGYLIQFMKEEMGEEEVLGLKENGQPYKKTVYGIERIPDKMVLKELLEYEQGVNTDRVIALTAAITYAYIQLANIGYKRVFERNISSSGNDNGWGDNSKKNKRTFGLGGAKPNIGFFKNIK